MGMPVSVDIPNCHEGEVFRQVFAQLRGIDDQFSPFRPDSELSRYRRGEITQDDLSIGLRDVIRGCQEAEAETDGYFSAHYGQDFDPTGYVKGWAIKQGCEVIDAAGYHTYCLSAGGDINAKSSGDKIWHIGIQDPRDKAKIIKTITGKNFAVATSGNYERGQHIINPKTGRPPADLISLTAVGPDIIKADVLATAAYAMGRPGLNFIEHKALAYEALAIDKEGKVLMTKDMDKLITGSL